MSKLMLCKMQAHKKPDSPARDLRFFLAVEPSAEGNNVGALRAAISSISYGLTTAGGV